MQGTWVRPLVREDPLEKGMATHSSILFIFFFFHSSILSWRVSWTEEPGGSMGSLRVGCDWATNTFGQSSRKVIDGSHGKSMFSFIRNCQTVLQRGCIILHSHQQWIQAPVILHLHQHLVLSMFWILILPIEGAVLLVHFCFVLFCFVGGGRQVVFFLFHCYCLSQSLHPCIASSWGLLPSVSTCQDNLFSRSFRPSTKT